MERFFVLIKFNIYLQFFETKSELIEINGERTPHSETFVFEISIWRRNVHAATTKLSPLLRLKPALLLMIFLLKSSQM